ncbi:MAG: hypothetical protein KGL74_11585, partial [Elusimicrobia bacterium]|nr:hypothetical protein [Elusimicrobiota bacterium]
DASAAVARGLAAVRKTAAASAPAFAAQGAPKEYAATIVCDNAPKAAGLPSHLKFYTHLDGRRYVKQPSDDTASGLNDYLGSGLRSDGLWHFDAWSCDTQDYWFTFDAVSLLKATAGETSRAVKGRARIETRGQVDWEGDLDCVANW